MSSCSKIDASVPGESLSSLHAFLQPPTGEEYVVVTCQAPSNIATTKYWGKRDEGLILPFNSSMSGTLDPDVMCSTTTIVAARRFDGEDFDPKLPIKMYLNEREEKLSPRHQAVLGQLLAQAGDYKDESGSVLIRKDQWKEFKFKVVSHNNFPTAAGLASSASGFACLAKALATLLRVRTPDGKDGAELDTFLSTIARQGSGSACRSLFGGWVKWEEGERADGADSHAVQIADEAHWPDMRVLVLVVNAGRKETSSTSGMRVSMETSELMQKARRELANSRLALMVEAIRARDFEKFAELTMKDSNTFHAVCLDTFPPIAYLNDVSHRIIRAVHEVNALEGRTLAAYTFDAGPNAVIYLPAAQLDSFLALFLDLFSPADGAPASLLHDPLALSRARRGGPLEDEAAARWTAHLRTLGVAPQPGALSQVIVTRVGSGPRIVRDAFVPAV